MRIVILSAFKQDEELRVEDRCAHLLEKQHYVNADVEYIIGVGDSSDRTREIVTSCMPDAHIVNNDTHHRFDIHDASQRFYRLGYAWNIILDEVPSRADYCVIHESDLVSPPDIVDSLYRHALEGHCPIAAWPMLNHGGERGWTFYDTWAYRGLNDVTFSSINGYHQDYKPDEIFEVHSVGSLWMFHAEDVLEEPKARMFSSCCLDLCRVMREGHGRRVWVDPTLVVKHPKDIWINKLPDLE